MPPNKVFQNAKWIVICKIVQSLMQMVIGMITARYLGPSNYGLVSYAASVVAFAVPIMQLGLSSTLVQEYVSKPEEEGKVAGTCLAMNLASGLACMVGVVSFAATANRGDRTTILVCALYSVCLIFQATEMLQYWFQAKLLSKHSSMAMLVAYLIVSAYKIFLLISGKSVYWFALSHAVEYGTASIFLMIAYKRCHGKRLSFSMQTARDMFSRSRYYVVANLMVTLFQNVSQILLKQFSGSTENGFYTTALTCTTITGFVLMAIIDSMRPVVLESRKKSLETFEANISRLYSLMIYLTLAQSVCFTFLAKPIVWILYGQDYLPAVPVLRIAVWQLAFSYMGTVRNIWILGEGKYPVLWRINLAGVIANVILNVCLIPAWGACGAALASVLTQFFTNFVVGFIMKPIRRNNDLLLRGLNPRYILELAAELKK